jgi:hypothetical protein
MMPWILLVHAAATWFMTGLIWFVQVVHYPLFDRVGTEASPRYAVDHQRRTMLVVMPVMLIEALTATALVWLLPTSFQTAAWSGMAMLVAIWLSTAFVQVPRHAKLRLGFDARASSALVTSNWIRTVLWTARGVLALWLLSAR